jgi:hypothetical protein
MPRQRRPRGSRTKVKRRVAGKRNSGKADLISVVMLWRKVTR